jgi:hypothetical protein
MKDQTIIINNIIYVLFIISICAFMLYSITEHTAKTKAMKTCQKNLTENKLYSYTRTEFSTNPTNIQCVENLTLEVQKDLMRQMSEAPTKWQIINTNWN